MLTAHEMMVRTEAEDRARAHAEYLEREAYESVEAEEARWTNRFRQQAAEMPEVHYDDRPGIDRRHFAVDGEIPEQARRDIDPPVVRL